MRQERPDEGANSRVAQANKKAAPGPMAMIEAGFGTTPRIPLTGFIVFGLLTFWVYTAVRLALLVRDHAGSRWQEFATSFARAGVEADRVEAARRRGFETGVAVPIAAACIFGIDAALVAAWFLHWIVLGADLDYATIMSAVGGSSALFYAATCMLVVWTTQRIHAHEIAELAIRERGPESVGNHRVVPEESLVSRWEQINNHVALFLIVALPIAASPTVAAHLFLTGATAASVPLPSLGLPSALTLFRGFQGATAADAQFPALVCFALAGVFHFWGTQLLGGLFNSHLAIEAEHGGVPPAGAPAAATSPAAPADDDGLEPYTGSGPFIFVSYKREDFERIRPVLRRIHTWGYRFWYDKGIPGGAEWDALIEEKLKGCAMLLFFVSRGSVESKYCRREVKYVDQLNKPILSLRLEPAELGYGLQMLLTQYQMIDSGAEDFAGEIERALKYMRLL